MKKIKIVFILFMLMIALTACANSENNVSDFNTEESINETSDVTTEEIEPEIVNEEKTSSNSLVVYFSATGTTKGVAERIAEIVDADIYELKAAESYTEDDLNYNDSNSRATQEQNDSTSRPEIEGEIENFDEYDTIFLGYPIWWGDAPHIIYTLVESYDFDDKTVIPFCTSGSSSITLSVSNLKQHSNGGNWLEGKRMSQNTSNQEIEQWISSLVIEGEETMRIVVKCNNYEIVYELNNSKAAKDLYAQLPITLNQEDFSNNEKTFYPPEKLDVTGATLASGGSGVLAYYEPWGDVVMFYGDFASNGSLYELGKVVSGEEYISQISGTIEISKEQ